MRDVTEQYGGEYAAAAVGEVNVTTKMKEVGALIGGEGNGVSFIFWGQGTFISDL